MIILHEVIIFLNRNNHDYNTQIDNIYNYKQQGDTKNARL